LEEIVEISVSHMDMRCIPVEDENEDQEMTEEEQREAQQEMAKLLTNVKDMALYNMSMIASQAWHHLGLVPVPGTEKAEVDLEQAKLAIDLYEANLEILGATLDKDARKQFKQVLMDLQLNFVNKQK
jgi:hypothetical protein